MTAPTRRPQRPIAWPQTSERPPRQGDAAPQALFITILQAAPVHPEPRRGFVDQQTQAAELVDTLAHEPGRHSGPVLAKDGSELLEARRALAESRAEMQRLLAERDRIQEAERQRIARELHDELQQTLAAIRIQLAAVTRYLDGANPEVLSLIDESRVLAAAAIEANRRIISDLRPQALEDLGLVAALESLVAQFRRRTGIACRLRAGGDHDAEPPLALSVAFCLYRVTQESLGNVGQHAHASEVEVKLARTPAGQVVLRISDNGKGMVSGQAAGRASFGLIGVQERVRSIGAVLRIESAAGTGTTIEVTVPPSRGDAAPASSERSGWGRRATDAAPDQGCGGTRSSKP